MPLNGKMEPALVQLPPSTIAFLYQSGLEHIGQAYRAAASAMSEAARDAEAASISYLKSGQDDSVYEVEDGQSILVSSTQHELEYARLEVAFSLTAVREAFIISSFHYWEKWARSLTKLNGRKDTFNVVKRHLAKDYAVHDQLYELNHLTNLLKHGSGATYHALSLAKVRPDLFSRLPEGGDGWAVSLSDDTVQEALKIVSASGPNYDA